MTELREAGGNGGNSVSVGASTEACGDNQSKAFRLTRNEAATTAVASRIVLRRIGRRIVPPD